MANHPRHWKRRTWELCKSALIPLLICSAVFLVSRTQISQSVMQTPAVRPGTTAPVGGTTPSASTQPVRMVSTQVEGDHVRHYGVQYGDVSEVYTAAAPLLSEAMSAAGPPRVITDKVWRSALQSVGLYFDFLGEIPLSTLTLWLIGTPSQPLPGAASVRRLCLASQNGAVALYYHNETDGKSYACEISSDLSDRLSAVTARFPGNRAAFAFQLGVAYERLEPDTLILPEPPEPLVYTTSNPLGTISSTALDGVQTAILRAFSFHPQLTAIYPITDGVAVNEGGDTLRLYDDGTLTYTASDLTDVRLPITSDPVETVRVLAEASIGALCGSARLYLSAVTPTENGQTISFQYCLSGAAVQLAGEAPAARFTIENGVLIGASLRFRSYAPTAQTTLVLPELQAAAAATALHNRSGNLLLRYEDFDAVQTSATWSV